ncbi:hypothetical protein HGM15179_004414 [Zosterops borbonicus]|uniref:Uncharacterized protein n=1 Tax=Zosterops borbonicus TaxID=364589 RepID=A0A8K1GRR8_9PASS|nr:hypothetical protein HGM15179_004414 [Zosterops borbonicus]
MPAGSNMDLPQLAKAEPISDGGSTSGIIDLTRQEHCTGATPQERGVKLCERQLCRQQGEWWCRRGKRCSRQQGRDSSTVHGEDYGEAAVPLQPGGSHSGAGGRLKEAVTPWEACDGADS